MLKVLGDPQQSFRSVHIAGTNGKGSVSAMCASIFQEAGHRTGLYTSPHLVEFEERIQVDGVNISHEEMTDLAEEMRALVRSDAFPEGRDLTFFEITTAMAFLHFARKKVEIAVWRWAWEEGSMPPTWSSPDVLEVGMGGRLDATMWSARTARSSPASV